MSQYYITLTAVGAAKLANLQALGQSLQVTQFAVGDGNGAYVAPDDTWTALTNEVYRAPLNQIYQDPNNANYVVCEGVIPQDQGGWYVREVGIFDVDGDLILVGAYPAVYKPTIAEGAGRDLYIRAVTELGAISGVALNIDPSIVLATRKYVDDSILQHEAADHNGALVDLIYPVGSIYISTVSTNPATLFGHGTWMQTARGRVLIGEGTSDQPFNAGDSGGESKHLLTTDEMPLHNHRSGFVGSTRGNNTGAAGCYLKVNACDNTTGSVHADSFPNAGGSQAHNNLPPYLVAYIWERTG